MHDKADQTTLEDGRIRITAKQNAGKAGVLAARAAQARATELEKAKAMQTVAEVMKRPGAETEALLGAIGSGSATAIVE